MARTTSALLIASLLTLGACDETDGVAVRIRLLEDLSGTVRTSALALPTAPGSVERESQGASWGSRVEVDCASGTFADFSSLKIADIEFGAGEGGQAIGFAKIVLPRGPDARWPKAFVPLSAQERAAAATALDPSGKSHEVGATIKIEIELPSAVVGNGLTGKTRGSKATAEGSVATLVVPLEPVATEGEPIVWHLTWQR